MEDTSPEIKTIYRRIIMVCSEEERFVMCAEMFESARTIALAAMPKNLSVADQKRFIYERIYGELLPDDFPLE